LLIPLLHIPYFLHLYFSPLFVKRNRIDRYRAQSRSPSPRKGDKQGCFHCGVMGHFKRECPKLESPSGEKRVSFQENKEALNSKGATHEA
jgi:hypothetical protein